VEGTIGIFSNLLDSLVTTAFVLNKNMSEQ